LAREAGMGDTAGTVDTLVMAAVTRPRAIQVVTQATVFPAMVSPEQRTGAYRTG
jgi:hypothetical protein